MHDKPSKTLYTTIQFARRIGVSRCTVFNYQKRGILPDRRNTLNNRRVFTEEDVERMLSLIRAKKEKRQGR